MEKDVRKLFGYLKQLEMPSGLSDRIILAIKREQELRQTRKLLFSFLALSIVSVVSIPFSWTILVNQLNASGITYFISAAVGDFNMFIVLWKDFSLAILESLPVTGLMIFALSLGIFIFTLRLFLHKKGLLLTYVRTRTV